MVGPMTPTTPMKRASLDSLPARNVLDVSIHAVSMEQCVALCDDAIASRERLTIGVVNAAKMMKMRSDRLLRDSVVGADLIVADGMAVVWASRILGQRLPERVTGIDLFEELLSLADRKNLSVYLLGAAAEVLEELVRRVRSRFPGVRIAGYRDGYFSDVEAEQVAFDISAAKPDMLFVGITTPKKELFLEAWGPKLDVTICHGVGGSFDVMAGKTSRAPVLWQRLGIEWLWRVVQEPTRMWKRYLVTNGQFIALVAREWIRTRFWNARTR
jgi:N-acetylglucosaminyldiphosphoundecaprenol N-acetyl-beta-D-mannosaminyltransferase